MAFGDPKYPKLPEKRVAARLDAGATETWIDMSGDVILEGEASPRPSARGGLRFEPLPETRREVREIAALFAPKSEAYLGLDATEERAKAIGKDVPLIHYACHAVVNERFRSTPPWRSRSRTSPGKARTTDCSRRGRSSRRCVSTRIS